MKSNWCYQSENEDCFMKQNNGTEPVAIALQPVYLLFINFFLTHQFDKVTASKNSHLIYFSAA